MSPSEAPDSCDVVGLDDLLDERMPDHIGVGEVDEVDAFDLREDFFCVPQATARPTREIDLRHVAGDHRLRVEAEAGQEHLHLLRVVFCASSRTTKLSLSVRPRMKARGATSIVPRSISAAIRLGSIMSWRAS